MTLEQWLIIKDISLVIGGVVVGLYIGLRQVKPYNEWVKQSKDLIQRAWERGNL